VLSSSTLLLLGNTFSLTMRSIVHGARGSIVVEALYYKQKGRGFETECGEYICFSIYLILLPRVEAG
jgi:hypothetical protein